MLKATSGQLGVLKLASAGSEAEHLKPFWGDSVFKGTLQESRMLGFQGKGQ
jgi:hypothetical protein